MLHSQPHLNDPNHLDSHGKVIAQLCRLTCTVASAVNNIAAHYLEEGTRSLEVLLLPSNHKCQGTSLGGGVGVEREMLRELGLRFLNLYVDTV